MFLTYCLYVLKSSSSLWGGETLNILINKYCTNVLLHSNKYTPYTFHIQNHVFALWLTKLEFIIRSYLKVLVAHDVFGWKTEAEKELNVYQRSWLTLRRLHNSFFLRLSHFLIFFFFTVTTWKHVEFCLFKWEPSAGLSISEIDMRRNGGEDVGCWVPWQEKRALSIQARLTVSLCVLTVLIAAQLKC